MWTWILCILGLLIITTGVLWAAIAEWEEDGVVVFFVFLGVGLLVIVIGWWLKSFLWLLSYLSGGLLYLASIILFGFGTWEIIAMCRDIDRGFSGRWRYENGAAGWQERASDWFDRYDDRDGPFHEQQHQGSAGDPQDETACSFDPWGMLGIPRGATRQEIHNAFREQMKLYHPDRVSYLGEDLRKVAERKAKDINRAYHMLKRR